MLKKRVIIQLLLNDGVLFRTKKFKPDYRYTSEFLGSENADEVMIIDVTPEGEGKRENFYKAAQKYADQCYTPITMGGKIKSMDEVGLFMRELGADKVVVERGLHGMLAREITGKYGRQALVWGISDRYEDDDGSWEFAACGADGRAVLCGELLLTSVDRDGSLSGYSIGLLSRVLLEIGASVPVTIAGGCSGWRDMQKAFDAGASGAATSNIHHLSESALKTFKENLVKNGAEVRP